MSGNGSGPTYAPSRNNDCGSIVIVTNLSSPNGNVISNLSIGDTLSITAQSDQGPLVAIDGQGNIAGSIFSSEMINLLNCIINEGVRYIAVVREIDGAQCSVRISAE